MSGVERHNEHTWSYLIAENIARGTEGSYANTYVVRHPHPLATHGPVKQTMSPREFTD